MDIRHSVRSGIRAAATAGLAAVLALAAAPASAQDAGERYIPTIWVDPDGCEHWVMDDGFEGYMTPNVSRNGIPVCRDITSAPKSNVCGTLDSDQLFSTGSYAIGAAARDRLVQFFRTTGAKGYTIEGHTDSRGGAAYNQQLSVNRANAVAAVAKAAGANVVGIRGYGESKPRASNATAQGMAQNRRVEIICVR